MKKNKLNLSVTIIGAGNVATTLGVHLKKKGIAIQQIYSTTFSSSKKLARTLNAEAIKNLSELSLKSDIYILAVNDDSIEKVVTQLKLKDKIIVHTSGTVEMFILKKASKNFGVFYPLQTFSKNNSSSLKKVPILIEGNTKKTESILSDLGKLISHEIHFINSNQRKQIHLAAVLVSNFTNHLYALSEEYLKKEKIDFKLLLPLIKKVTENLENSSPKKNQTGPAKRGDKKTMQEHLTLLKKDKNLAMIYSLMSKSIKELEKNS